MKNYPHYPNRTVHDLDGLWDFCFCPEIDDPQGINLSELTFNAALPVPGVFDAYTDYLGERGVGVYRTFAQITPGCSSVLSFGGLGLWAQIYVDGQMLHTCRLPYSGFKVMVPPSDSSKRELIVVIDNRFNFERTPLMEQFFDFYGYGGIYRSVNWTELPSGAVLSRAYIKTLDIAAGTIEVTAECSQKPQSVRFSIDGIDMQPQAYSFENGAIKAQMKIEQPKLWSPESPNLYELTLTTEDDCVIERFGLRLVETHSGKVWINGKDYKLKGFCRHEAHPQFGPALPYQQLVQDIQSLKDMGCNFVRGSHYPQDQRFLDLCDKMGIMVFEEALGWGQKEAKYAQDDFVSLQKEQCHLMIENSYNHPSIIMWGMLNEGGSNVPELSDLYRGLLRLLKEKDPSRAVTYASNEAFTDIHFEYCDIISINTYPGWYYSKDLQLARPLEAIHDNLEDITNHLKSNNLGDKPLLISEIGAGAIYGWRDAYQTRWSEGYQDEHLKITLEEITTREDIAGVAIWQFCDCRTYASVECLKRPRGFNNKGVLDEYRRPKIAYNTIKKIFRK